MTKRGKVTLIDFHAEGCGTAMEINDSYLDTSISGGKFSGNGQDISAPNAGDISIDGVDFQDDLAGNKTENRPRKYFSGVSFDALLGAMAQGEAPSAQKKSATRPASSKDGDGDCDETRTRPDTSRDGGGINIENCDFAFQSPRAILWFLLKDALLEVLRNPLGLRPSSLRKE